MSKKKVSNKMSSATATDRHKPRKMVGLSLRLHSALQELAERNHRPVTWELELAIKRHLKENGLLPPEDQRGA